MHSNDYSDERESATEKASRYVQNGKRSYTWLKIIGGLIAAILAIVGIMAIADDDDDEDDGPDNDSMGQMQYDMIMYIDADIVPTNTLFAELRQHGYSFKDRQVLSATQESQIWRNKDTATLIEVELLEDDSWGVRAISTEKLWCLPQRGETLRTTELDFNQAQQLRQGSPLKQVDADFWQVELGEGFPLTCYTDNI